METQQLRERNYSTEAEIDDEEEEGVFPAEVLEGMKHGDGSIYRPDAYQMHSLYRIADTTEGNCILLVLRIFFSLNFHFHFRPKGNFESHKQDLSHGLTAYYASRVPPFLQLRSN